MASIMSARIPRRKRILFGMSASLFLYALATSIMQYFLPLTAEHITPNYTTLGLLMGLPWFFSLLTDMPIGAFADRFGRKQTLILGFIGMGTTGVLLHYASGTWWLFAFLAVFGIFEGFVTVSAMAAVIAASKPGEEHRFVGIYEGVTELGYVFGAIAAGVVVGTLLNWSPFIIFAVICYLISFFAAIFIPGVSTPHETAPRAFWDVIVRDGVYRSELKEFFSAGRLSWFFASLTVFSGMWYEFLWVMEPLLIEELKIPHAIGGLVLSLVMATLAILDYPIGIWIDWSRARYASLLSGFIVACIGIAAFGLVMRPSALIALAIVTGIGISFFDVALDGLFDSFSDHRRRGYMSGVWQATEDIGFILGPVIGGLLADAFGFRSSFLWFGVGLLVISLWIIAERRAIKAYETAAGRSSD